MGILLLNSNFGTVAVERQMSYAWDIGSTVTKTLTYSWDIYSTIVKTLTYEWMINSYVTKDLTYSWDMYQYMTKDLTYSWDILGNLTVADISFYSPYRRKEINGLSGTTQTRGTR